MELNGPGIRVTVASHPGRTRTANQDQLVVSTMISGGNFVKVSEFAFALPELVAVIDGMGGHAGGEVAARTAASVLASCWVPPTGPDQLERLIQGANDAIYDAMEHQPELAGMGATVVTVVPTDRGWLIGHVGDARAYGATDGVALRLTEDDRGARGDLSQALGGLSQRSAVDVHLACHDYESCRRLLLCSDGLPDVVAFGEIQDALAEPDDRAALEVLLTACLDGGAPDNVTIGLISLADEARQDDG